MVSVINSLRKLYLEIKLTYNQTCVQLNNINRVFRNLHKIAKAWHWLIGGSLNLLLIMLQFLELAGINPVSFYYDL